MQTGRLLLLTTVAVVCSVALASTRAFASAVGGEAQPTWSAGLEQIDSFKHFLHSPLMIAPQLAFIDKDRLAVSFLNPCSAPAAEVPPRLKKRDEEKIPCVLTLTVLLLDVKSGQVEHTLTFPFHTVRQSKPSSPPGQGLRLLMPTRAGEFVIHTGGFLLRYGPNLELIQKRPIGNPDRTVVFVSPGGTLVVLSEYEDVNKFRKFVFPSDNIESGSLFGEGWPGEGVTDDGKVLSLLIKSKLSDPQSSDFRRTRSGMEKCERLRGDAWCLSLCVAENDCEVLGGFGPIVDNTRFATIPVNKKFVLVDVTGKVLYKGSTADRIYGFVTGTAAAEKLVVKSERMGIPNWKFVFSVLDLRDMATVHKVTWEGSGGTTDPGSGTKLRTPDAALSPDGAQIAIIVGSELRLYQLPARTP
jgi:hypothetical protein